MVSLGLYIPRRSLLHRISAQSKLLGLTLAAVLVFLTAQIMILLGILAIGLGLLLLAKLPIAAVWGQLRPMLPMLLAILLLQGLLENWQSGWLAVLRFTILLVLAALVTLTTRLSDLVEAIEQALQPAKAVGVNPAKVGLVLAMAIRFVPVLLEQYREVQMAQAARGLDRHWIALLVPLLVKTLRMADELSEALDARCYDPD